MYGGIVATNTGHRAGWDATAAPTQTKVTQTLAAVLRAAHAPAFVEFLSLDCEGCELGVLATFPFGGTAEGRAQSGGAQGGDGLAGPGPLRYRFGAIVVEHNHEARRRRQIRSLLERNGYLRAKAGAEERTLSISTS
jgi:hypothetical protein